MRRRNPNIYSQDLRPGDVISLDGIGREHVIEGPFRSGGGIKFRDQYGNTIKLKPNEVVQRVGRANPSIRTGTLAGTLQQYVAAALDDAGVLDKRTRFHETLIGGLQVTGIDTNKIHRMSALMAHLRDIANTAGFDFDSGFGSISLNPRDISSIYRNPARREHRGYVERGEGFHTPEPLRETGEQYEVREASRREQADRRHSRLVHWGPYNNPRSSKMAIARRSRRRKASKSIVRSFKTCVRKHKGGSKNPWALCRRKVQRAHGRKYKNLRNNPRGSRYEVWVKQGRGVSPVFSTDELRRANDRAHHLISNGIHAYVQDAATGRVVGPYTHGGMKALSRAHRTTVRTNPSVSSRELLGYITDFIERTDSWNPKMTFAVNSGAVKIQGFDPRVLGRIRVSLKNIADKHGYRLMDPPYSGKNKTVFVSKRMYAQVNPSRRAV